MDKNLFIVVNGFVGVAELLKEKIKIFFLNFLQNVTID